jgi:F-type H+-transporting ATPase subunit gamma
MATSLAIKRRIKSVQSIRQVTKTMQIVAASRMKKVQESAQSLRPYSAALVSILAKLTSDKESIINNPYFFRKETNKDLLIVVSPMRSLAGALPSALISCVFSWLKRNDAKETAFISINKKGFRVLKKQDKNIVSFYDNINYKSDVVSLEPIVEEIKKMYLKEGYSDIYIAYPKFINTLKQTPVVEKILPIDASILEKDEKLDSDFLIEPGAEELLADLVPHYIEMKLYDAIVNNSASEESARMIAMKNATDNAKDMIDDLVLTFNKARQMKITQQVAEISAAL